jgi:hypothetical protein
MSDAALAQARVRAQRIKRSWGGHAVARIGLGSRGIVYLALAGLVVQLVAGRPSAETDQGGVFQELRRTALGTLVLALLVFGIGFYVAWRWAEAALGASGEQNQRRARVQAVVEGACYLPFGIMAVAVLFGDPQQARQSGHYQTLSAHVLQWPGGQYLVGTTGLVIIGIGAFLASQGVRTSFQDQLDFRRSNDFWRRTTLILGVVGSIARGVVFALAGVFVLVAAVRADPSDAGGIDTALRSLAHDPWGSVLLLVAAAGFAAFGLFALAEAKWRIT